MFQTFAQNPELDSLQSLAENSTDSVRIDALLAWGRKLRQSDLEQAADVFETAKREAAQLGYAERQLRAANLKGIAYGMMGDYAQAMEQFRLGLKMHIESGNLEGIAESYNNLGIVHQYTGDYPKSLEAYRNSLTYYDSLDSKAGRAACFHNIGVVYDMMGEDINALEYFNKALVLKKEVGDELDYSLTLHSIALIYDNQAKYTEALQLLFEHLDIIKKHGDRIREASTLNTIGKIYISNSSAEAALPYLIESRNKCIELGLREPLAHVYYNLAKVELQKNRPQSAINFLNQQLDIATGINNKVLQKQGHDLLSEAYSKFGDFKKAYLELQLANSFRDSLFNTEKNNAFRQWQSRLDVYEKDQKLADQEQEISWMGERLQLNEQLRWALLAALIMAVATAVLFFQKHKLRQLANEVLAEKNKRIEAQRAEIELMNQDLERRMLRSQMNPHFIFNSLSSIQHFITANERESALRYLSKFSSLLRQVLEDSVNNTTILAEEIKLLKIYLDLESLRFDQDFEYHIHLDPELDPHAVEVPILLVQPYLENAILHGLMPKKGNRQLDIYFQKEDQKTICRIVDNGIGRKAAAELKAQKKGSYISRGMEVAKKRLEALNKNQKEKTSLEIIDLFREDGSSSGTEVIIKIPEG